MKRNFIFFLLFFYVSYNALAQVKLYLNLNGSQIDSLEYSRLRNDRINNFRRISNNFIFNEYFTEIEHNASKTLYSFKWEFKVSKDTGTDNVVINTYINGIRTPNLKKEKPVNNNTHFTPGTTPKRIAKRKPYINRFLINNSLPAFELITDYNSKINSDQLKGKPTFLFFWSTQYVDCAEQIENLNRLKEKFADKVNFIAITPDLKADHANFLKENKFSFIRLINAQAYFNKLKMDANSLPVCFFIDKNNNVVEIKTTFPQPAGKNNVDNLKDFESVLEKLI